MSQIAYRQRLRDRRQGTARQPRFTPATQRNFIQPGDTDFAATPIRPMAQVIEVAPSSAAPARRGRTPIAPAFNEPKPEGDGFDMHALFDARMNVEPEEAEDEDEPQGQPAHRDDLVKSVPPGSAQEEPAPGKDPTER